MARKKKRSSFSANLKYEVYGILIITLSVIALSAEATVGRSLSKLFGLLLGKFYFVIPLTAIYVGLYVMIHRRWPHGWSARKTGLVLVVTATVMLSTISGTEMKLGAAGSYPASSILKLTQQDLYNELLAPDPEHERPMIKKQISGGYVGAISYTLFYLLFGNTGAKLILIVMYAIGFMLITGKSYVELARGMRANVKRVFFLLQSRRAVAQRRTGAVSAVAEPDDTAYDPYDDNEEEDNDAEYIRESKRRKPLFFQLFKPETKRKSDEAAGSDESAEGGEPRSADHHSEIADEADLTGEADHSASAANEEEIPVIQSFEQHEPPAERVAAQEQPGIVSPPPAENEADADELTGERPEQPVQRKAEKPYRLPPLHLLSKPAASGRGNDQTDYKSTARKLEATLESFGVRAKVLAVVKGPSVTRYEVQPDIGVKVSRIVSLTDDIALALAAKDIRMEAPIPGKSAIGIEVPNNEVSVVTLREVMESGAFQDSPSKLSIALGRDISGQPIVGNLARMPHLLVAGATGSGKSVCINSIITSILFKAKPDEVKFLMIDPKMVELNVYNGIPHLMAPVVTDPKRASLALKKVVVEMEKRYELFSKSGTRNIEGYNSLMASNPANMLPYIVVIVDELADLMMVAANDVEDAIIRLAQMARAAGIHLIIATQRPSVDVITGVIKANIPSRIAFSVSSQVDSRTILDMAGAEKLLGRGDMLYMPVGASKPVRVQGANLSDKEVEAVTDFVRNQQQAEYQEDIVPQLEESSAEDEYVDELYDQAVQIVLEAKQASVSLLQRRMRIGYTRAARLIDAMEAKGVVGPYEGSKPREVLLTLEQYQQNRISS